MRILITRPRDDAAALAEKLKARGHEIFIESMLDVRFATDVTIDLAGVQAVLFTSANGVRGFAGLEKRRDLQVLAVGDATAAAARAAGFTRVDSASGNLSDLVKLIRARLKPADGALFHASARDIAGDLTGAMNEAGFELRRAVLYSAEPLTALSPATAAVLKAHQVDLVVFYSPRSAGIFAQLVRDAGLTSSLSKTVALGLSPAVLEPVKDLPWAMMEAARRPDEADMLRAIVRQKIITQLEGAPAQDDSEVKFGRRVADPPPKPSQRPRGRLTGLLAGLAVILSLGTFALQTMQQNRTIPEYSGTTMLRLETRLAALERRPAPRAEPAPGAETDSRLAALTERIAALETGSTAPAPAPEAATPAQLEGLAARLDEIEKAQAARPDAGQLAALTADNRRLAGDLARVQEELAAASAASAASAFGPAAVLLATSQLRAAAARGAPLAAEIGALRSLAGDDQRLVPLLERLQPFANRRSPPVEELAARYPAAALAAARAARVTTLPTGGEWLDTWLQRLSEVITIRRVGDVPGETAEARIARAEQFVARRDIAGAVTALDGLTGGPADVFSAWLGDARLRVALDRAVDELTTASLAAAPR